MKRRVYVGGLFKPVLLQYNGFRIAFTDQKEESVSLFPPGCPASGNVIGVVSSVGDGFIEFDVLRNRNGHLVCCKCDEPFPHSEPNGDLFTCYQCRNGL